MPYKMTKPPKSMLGSPKKLSADSEKKKMDSATQAIKNKSKIKSSMTGPVSKTEMKPKSPLKNKTPHVGGKNKPAGKNTMPNGKMGSLKKVLR
jgi:hypothetical protein